MAVGSAPGCLRSNKGFASFRQQTLRGAEFWIYRDRPCVRLLVAMSCIDRRRANPDTAVLLQSPDEGCGRYSYSAYVWHILIRHFLQLTEHNVLHFTLPWVLRIPTLIALTFGVSVCSYAVIERPFLRLKRF